MTSSPTRKIRNCTQRARAHLECLKKELDNNSSVEKHNEKISILRSVDTMLTTQIDINLPHIMHTHAMSKCAKSKAK